MKAPDFHMESGAYSLSKKQNQNIGLYFYKFFAIQNSTDNDRDITTRIGDYRAVHPDKGDEREGKSNVDYRAY